MYLPKLPRLVVMYIERACVLSMTALLQAGLMGIISPASTREAETGVLSKIASACAPSWRTRRVQLNAITMHEHRG